MQVEILAHRKAIQQAVLKARFHAEQLAALVVPKMDCVSDPSFIPTEDRLWIFPLSWRGTPCSASRLRDIG